MSLLTNLISHYPVDANGNDSHGANNLTATDMSYVAGKISNAASFNGSTSKLIIDGNPFTASQGAFTAWAKTDVATNALYQVIFGYGGGNVATPGHFFLCFYGNGTNNSLSIEKKSDNETLYAAATEYLFAPNTWYYIVLNSDGSTWTLYVDNVLQTLIPSVGGNNGDWFGDTVVAETDRTGVGVSPQDGGYSHFFDGLIDQPEFYNQPLGADLRSQLYNSGSGLAYEDYDAVFISETVNSDDALADNMPTLVESATADDALADNMPTLVESATADDADTVGFSIEVATNESASSDENIVAGLQYSCDITETAAGDDTNAIGLEITINESAALDDGLVFGWAKAIDESLEFWETSLPGWMESLADTATITDISSVKLILLITDWLAARETITAQWNGDEYLESGLYLFDIATLVKKFSDTVTESLTLAETITPSTGLLISEYLNLRTLISSVGLFSKTVTDSLKEIDSAISKWLLSLTDTITVAETITLIGLFNKIITENIVTADAPTNLSTLTGKIQDNIVATDSLANLFELLATSALAIADTSTVAAQFYNILTDSITKTDTISVIKSIVATLTDSIIFSETVASQGTLYSTVIEGIVLSNIIELDGEIYECWVLNTPKFQPSIYTGFNFNSYCVFDGRAFGANSTGIFEITGDTDNGVEIHTGTVLSETRLGLPNKKRMRKAYLGVSGGSPVMIMEVEDGTKKVYTIDSKGVANASRSVAGEKWKLSIADFDELNYIKIVPVILAKGR